MQRKKITTRFFATERREEPVRSWFMDLTKQDRKIIGEDIKTVEFGWPIGMPVCRPLGQGLYEVRSNITDKRIARIIFCIKGNEMLLLHGFIKKSQKAPDKELDIAHKRKRDFENG